MPGLSGLFDRRGSGTMATPANLEAMLQRQMHQPWLQIQSDYQALFAAGRVYLGVHPTGPQPVCDSGRRYVLWFDGELYNHAELMALYKLDRKLWTNKVPKSPDCRAWKFDRLLEPRRK